MSRSRHSAPPARRPSSPPTGAAHATRIERLVAKCREAGMAVTPQRIAIYRALLEANDHPNPEAIYTRVRTTMPSVSLATIYKTLDALVRLGLVSELPATGNSRRYDANVDLHHHLVCTRCDRVTDYYDPALDRIPLPSRLAEFRARRVSVHIHGLCANCANARAPMARHRKPAPRRHVGRSATDRPKERTRWQPKQSARSSTRAARRTGNGGPVS
jgi:Fur family peroxide stress response transcriptional regulator